MNKDKNKLIPELRFPEFEKEGEWEGTELEELCINISSGKDKNISDGEFNLYGSTGIIGKSSIASYEGDFILVARVGANAGFLNRTSGKFSVTDNTLVIDLKNKVNTEFVFHSLEKKRLYKLVFGSGQPLITGGQLKSLMLPVPKSQEQQKIASCLSSLDEVIAAHSQKLDALKEHKKGLMQNLFPQEGESVPRYRFKEFENDGDWVEKKLGEMTMKVGSGVTPLGGETVYKKNGKPFVRSQNVGWGIFLIQNIAFIDEETHRNSINTEIEIADVLLNITGASIGRSAVANEQVSGGNVNQHVCIIRTVPKRLNPFFLCQYLISEFGQRQIDSFQAGGNRQGLNFVQIRSLIIPFSPTLLEQQKIASCLSSLDELITAQGEKIAQLKLHKKGLMQGLFPKINE